jgi:hypothetical protein
MSLTRDHGDFVFECGGCHATLKTETSNFDSAMNILRRSRWKPTRGTHKPGKGASEAEWEHTCEECQKGMFAASRRKTA